MSVPMPPNVPRPGAGGAGGAFSVDLDRAPQVIRDLTEARDQLEDVLDQARDLGKFDPRANDEVSRDAASILGAVADGGEGSLVHAAEVGVERLTALIMAIEAELHAYRSADEALARSLGDARA